MSVGAVAKQQYNNQPVGLFSNVTKGAIGGAIGAGGAAAAFRMEGGTIAALAIGGAVVGAVGGGVGASGEFFGMSHKHASWLGMGVGAGPGLLALKGCGVFDGEMQVIAKPLVTCALAGAVVGAIGFGVFNHGKAD
jgi:hypothetical protein